MSRFLLAFVFAGVLAVVVTLPLLTAGSASAKGKPEGGVFPFPYDTVFNPCTEAPHDIFGTYIVRFHDFEMNDPGRHHFNGVFRFEIETSDGFSGFAQSGDIDNGRGLFGEGEEQGMITSHFNGKLRNAAGQIISANGIFHLTVVDGELVAIVDDFRETCVGKPS